MNKTLVFYGGRPKGNTYKTVSEALRHLDADHVQWLHTRDLELPLCRGCMACILRGEGSCPHYDIMGPLREKLDAADLIILASPVYSLSVCASLKNVIDHFSYLFHRPAMMGKTFLCVTTTAGAAAGSTARYLASVTRWWGAEAVETLPIIVADMDIDVKRFEDKIRKTAEKLKKAAPSRPSWGNVLRFAVFRGSALMQSEGSADYAYWREMDWLNKAYYRKTPPMPLRTVFSRLLTSSFAAYYIKPHRKDKTQ